MPFHRLPWRPLLGVVLLSVAAARTIPAQVPQTSTAPVKTSATIDAAQVQDAVVLAAERLEPSVVSIIATHMEKIPASPEFFFGDPFGEFFERFFNAPGQGQPEPMPQRPRPGPREFRAEGLGSGVIIREDGLVLTNEHVIADAQQVRVVVYEGTGNGEKKRQEYRGKVIGKDPQTDLALVRIEANKKFPAAPLGDSDQMRPGQWAIAIGSPFGLSQTVTLGIVSAARQVLEIEGRQYQGVIQTDAAINRGNSGGPLINIAGQVVGINTAIYAPTGVFSGVGFAVPINQAKAIMAEMLKTGSVTRGWLGVELAGEITPAMQKAFGLPDQKGALVNQVMPDTPAAKGGLRRGDVVVAFNSRPVTSPAELQRFVSQADPKQRVALEVIREGKREKLRLRLGKRPDRLAEAGQELAPGEVPEKPGRAQEWRGAQVSPLTAELAQQFGQPPGTKGVLVQEVKLGTPAEAMGLMPGDVIQGVNRQPTPTVDALKKAVTDQALKGGVVLDVLRQGKPLYLSYTPER